MSRTTTLEKEEGLIVVCAGLISFWLAVYQFGVGNHFEQVPGILRWIHPELFGRDFETRAATEYGGRTFYYLFMAALGRHFGLWQSYLAVALGAWLGWAFAIWHLLRRGLELSAERSFPILILFLVGTPFTLGATSGWIGPSLTPASVAWPLMVAMLSCAICRQWWLFLVWSVVAVLFHPLLVAGIAAILAASSFVRELSPRVSTSPLNPGAFRPLLVFGLFGAWYVGIWLLPLLGGSRLPSGLGDILLARAPQHYSPVFFWRSEVPGSISALASFAVAALALRRVSAPLGRNFDRLCWTAIIVTVLAWVVGSVGTELLHSTFIIAAQVFRFSLIPCWFGTILVGRLVVACVERRQFAAEFGAGLAVGGFLLQDGGLVLVAVLVLAAGSGPKISINWVRRAGITALAAAGCFYWFEFAWKRHWALFVAAGIIWIGARASAKRPWLPAALAAGAVALSLACFAGAGKYWRLFPPTSVRTEDEHYPLDGVAQFAKTHSRQDDLFLTPPRGERFRLVAERAIVVGALGFPNRPELFFEWRRRMLECYGSCETERMERASDARYRTISDHELLRLGLIYGFDFAVLFRDSASAFPVVYQDHDFKLVAMPQSRAGSKATGGLN